MRQHYFKLMTISICCLLATGCVDFVREGITGGVTRGFERALGGVVEAILEGFLED